VTGTRVLQSSLEKDTLDKVGGDGDGAGEASVEVEGMADKKVLANVLLSPLARESG
jgi:hypothetical protein